MTEAVAINWRERLDAGAFEEALAQVRALELVGQGDVAARSVLERVVAFREHLRAGKFDEAVNVSREGWSEVGINTLGLEEALRLIGKPTEAELDGAIEHAHPLTLADAHNNKGKSLVNTNSAQAEGHFNKALEADPRHYRAMTNLGNIALENKDLERAISMYRKAIELAPEYATAHNNLAAALRRQGKLSESVSSLKRSQKLAMQQFKAENSARSPLGKSGQSVTRWLDNPTVRWGLLALAVFLVYRFLAR